MFVERRDERQNGSTTRNKNGELMALHKKILVPIRSCKVFRCECVVYVSLMWDFMLVAIFGLSGKCQRFSRLNARMPRSPIQFYLGLFGFRKMRV